MVKISNKGLRQEIKLRKYKRRLKLYKLDSCNALRTTSKPCSCFICKGDRFDRKLKHKNKEQ